MFQFTGIPAVDRRLADIEPTRDAAGNTVRHLFIEGSDRYLFDVDMDLERWAQFDTEGDASYFGIWISKQDLRVLTFAEGDLTAEQCLDEQAFDRAVAELCRGYPPAPAFRTFDVSTGTMTQHYEDRDLYFIDAERGRAFLEDLRASAVS